MLQCSIFLNLHVGKIMETILICSFLAGAIGLRLWASEAYADFYDQLPDAEQKSRFRRAMQSGS